LFDIGCKIAGIASYFEAKAKIRWSRRSGEDGLKQGCIKREVIFARALSLDNPHRAGMLVIGYREREV
jgi:hypothetical protein